MVAEPITDHEREIAKLDARIEELEEDVRAERERVEELEAEVRGDEAAEEEGRQQGDERTRQRVLERLQDVERGLLTLDEYLREINAESRHNFYGR